MVLCAYPSGLVRKTELVDHRRGNFQHGISYIGGRGGDPEMNNGRKLNQIQSRGLSELGKEVTLIRGSSVLSSTHRRRDDSVKGYGTGAGPVEMR